MNKPDVDVLRSLCELLRSSNFQRFVEWIRQSHAAYREALEDAPQESIRHLQGRTKELGELLRYIDTAYEVLKSRIEEQELSKVIQPI